MPTLRFSVVLLVMVLSSAGSMTRAQQPAESAAIEIDDSAMFREPDEKTAAQIDFLISQLGVPDYKDRERATDDLVAVGLPGMLKLRDEYRRTDDPEVRLRIERIVRNAYLDHFVYDRNGFLGIQQNPVYPEADERIPRGFMWIRIGKVIPGTAAEAAGILAGDLLTAVDGQAIPRVMTEEAAQAFGESIRVRGPGARISFTIIRDQTEFEMELRLGRRPRELYQGQGLVITDMLEQALTYFEKWWFREFAVRDRRSIGPR